MMKYTYTKHRGAAMLLFVLFFAFSSSVMMFMLNQSIFVDLTDYNQLVRSKQGILLADSITEDIVHRRVFGISHDSVEQLTLGGFTAYATTTYDLPSDIYTITSGSQLSNVVRKSEATLSVGAGSSFNYGLQAGNGGITLSNNSDIYGNVYSNGTIQGAGSAKIFGDMVSAGATGLIADMAATGSAFANTIDNIDVDADAHYNVDLGSSVVAGTRFTPVTNQPTVELPIATTTIQEWKDAILSYGTTIAATDPACLSGTYTIDSSVTIGYLKVECNLILKQGSPSTIITLDGPVWVEGNLDISQSPELRVDASLGRFSVQLIADDPSDRTTGSKISIANSPEFYGSGDSRSYIMLISMNEDASNGGGEVAIDVANSANGDVLVYAGEGLITIGNNIDLREVTAYQIDVANGSSITYESGLASLLFTSGPGGGYTLDDWQQIE